MRAVPTIIATCIYLTGCAGDDGIEDGETDDFTSADGKADGYDLSEPQALAVMELAGTLTEAQLKSDAGVASRAARAIATYRAGADRRLGTADDQAFDSLVELDALAYVGPRTLENLLASAETRGVLDEGALGRHDVSILVPVPATGDLPWKASLPGKGGALLPKSAFDKIGRSVFNAVPEPGEYDALRVVAVRFDPCFTTSLTAACQPQVRLVFQALDGEGGTFDGAVHALYNLSADQHADVVARLRALEDKAPQNRAYAPLGINPALKAQGMTGAYATGLAKIITDHAGPATLARMTFVTRTLARQGQWELGGFHIKATAATGFPAPGAIKIIGNETLQVLGNGGFGGGHRYTITPDLADPAGRTGTDSLAIPALSATAKKQLSAWALAQQSPLATVPDTTDCSSCHIAGHVSNALEAADPRLVSLDRGPRVIAGAERTGDNLRSFGYFGAEPVIAIRTANETSAVLRAIAAQR